MPAPTSRTRHVAPELHDAVDAFRAAPARDGKLDARTSELVRLALYASACTLYGPGIRAQVERSISAGATPAEIADVLASIAPLGNHAFAGSLPAILDEFAQAGVAVEMPPITERAAAIKDAFVTSRGYWTDQREQLARYLPEFFAGYMELSSAPWTHGVLEPKVRELMLIAIDCSVAHMYVEGVRIHTRNAIRLGATPDELFGVLEIAATMGVVGFDAGMGHVAELADETTTEDAGR